MEIDPSKLRSYFEEKLDNRHYVVGTPKILTTVPEPCPNCGCKPLSLIQVTLEGHPAFEGQRARGNYIGCPACPYASPMVMIISV